MPKNYSIVGMNFRKSEDFVKSLAPGRPAVLVREPRNEFDPNAVAVWIEGRKVGYIPKAQNKVLAGFIDQSGRQWAGPSIPGAEMALDEGEVGLAIDAEFVRSPNSNYPMVKV